MKTSNLCPNCDRTSLMVDDESCIICTECEYHYEPTSKQLRKFFEVGYC